MFLRFAYSSVFYLIVPLLFFALLYRLRWYRSPVYVYPLAGILHAHNFAVTTYHKKILSFIRFVLLVVLGFMIGRPQWVDEKSHVNVDGVDIVIALDVSASMELFDDLNDRRSRIDVAKNEAIRFINKRHNDPIGLVFFGKTVVSRAPLTLDKAFLRNVVGQANIGIVDPRGTSLGTGLALAVSRLRKSKAKSKIIILLTDGEPSPQEKVSPESAVDLAKKFGIKVYTVGIGSQRGGYQVHPFFGLQRQQIGINIGLLEKIAQETNGRFFQAHNPKDMRTIYNTIDALEKTEYETTLFSLYYEAFLTFIWVVLMLLCVELLLRLFVWRGV